MGSPIAAHRFVLLALVVLTGSMAVGCASDAAPRFADAARGDRFPRDGSVDSASDSPLNDGGPSEDSATPTTPTLSLSLANIDDGQSLPHPLARIEGTVETTSSWVEVSGSQGESVRWPVKDGYFKALVRLIPGENTIRLATNDEHTTFTLTHTPQTNPHLVRFVYVKTSDGDGSFQAPSEEASTAQSALARIGLAADMLQTFVAESLQRQRGVRRTFRLARDADGKADILLHTSAMTSSEALGMSQSDLWSQLYSELAAIPNSQRTIFVAILGFTRYDSQAKELKGHAALGGNGLAIFGSSSLHTWPENLGQVPERLASSTLIDGTTLFDDSAGRQRAWANYATGLGATLQELGNCLELLYTEPSETFIMSRGFDHLLRWFSISEPASAQGDGIPLITQQDEPRWHPASAAWLMYQRHLDLDKKNYESSAAPYVTVDSTKAVAKSATSLGAISVTIDGQVRDYKDFGANKTSSYEIPFASYLSKYGNDITLNVVAIDIWGNTGESGPFFP